MQSHETTQRSTLLKKYLVKRQRLREQPLPDNSSIFQKSIDQQDSRDLQRDPFQKYQTMTTNADNTSALHSFFEEASSARLQTVEADASKALPPIMNGPKRSLGGDICSKNAQQQYSTLQLKNKELSRHVSDPYCRSLEKTISRRVQRKHGLYQREWVRSQSKRGGNSILQTSLEKASKNVKNINVDAQRRKNTTKLQEMLRNNIAEKTFIFPADFNPEISGLKGRGGRVVSLFQRMHFFEEVLKIHRNK